MTVKIRLGHTFFVIQRGVSLLSAFASGKSQPYHSSSSHQLLLRIRHFIVPQVFSAQRRSISPRHKMPFSISCKLLLVTVLCFLPAQGQDEHEKLNFNEIFPACCMTASKAHIKKPVIQCYEQKKDSFPNCKIHSFIFVTVNQTFCVDPSASWLPERLQRLKNKGIICKLL